MKRYGALALLLALACPCGAEQRCDTSAGPLSSPSSRFEERGDGKVLDRGSRLMWMRCSAGQRWSSGTCEGSPGAYSWPSAQTLADELNLAGEEGEGAPFDDWRLPSLRELATIVELRCQNPRINLSVFPGTPAGFYWTSSSGSRSGAVSAVGPASVPTAYALSFGPEGVAQMTGDRVLYVRLVRTGH